MELNTEEQIRRNRDFCKSPFGEEREPSDQQKQLPQPPLCKPAQSDRRIPLGQDFRPVLTQTDFLTILERRASQRFYKDAPMTLDQLSFLLWATQGVKALRGNHYATLRTVPSGGARHAFETYLAVQRVQGLDAGVYHYLPLEHALEPIGPLEDPAQQIVAAVHGQKWAGGCAVAFLYSFVPYRAEWRYSTSAHRVALIDVGHVVQNLYLACEAIGCGTCAVAAIDQPVADALCQVDGDEEFIVYAAPVGLSDPEKNQTGNQQLYAQTIAQSNEVSPLKK
ncbi:MAG: SagB/ThcOx family dehydrogenase [Oscillospiraceae bacterium]|nr:SagB/ThcOx family dehydrogenase [Oscillospiraceae bacterium]